MSDEVLISAIRTRAAVVPKDWAVLSNAEIDLIEPLVNEDIPALLDAYEAMKAERDQALKDVEWVRSLGRIPYEEAKQLRSKLADVVKAVEKAVTYLTVAADTPYPKPAQITAARKYLAEAIKDPQ